MKLPILVSSPSWRLRSSPARGTWVEMSQSWTSRLTKVSSPARGTWVEIHQRPPENHHRQGRPPHGGRGLKCQDDQYNTGARGSSPARGTWVEMDAITGCSPMLASSPARGTWVEISGSLHFGHETTGRPPHGGRGLKSGHKTVSDRRHWSSPARGTWVEIGEIVKSPERVNVVPRTGDVG